VLKDAFTEEDWSYCIVHGGGPAPRMALEGRCAERTMEVNGETHVIWAQEWRCADFSGDILGYEPCSGEFGRYYAAYLVNEDGSEEYIDSYGQFPPFLAE
jgi:hypothetical protein